MSRPVIDRFICDPGNWKLGFLYFCRADSRVVVPRRIRNAGWTLNFARPMALPVFAYLLAVLYDVMELGRALGPGGDARFGLKLLLALVILTVAYRFLNRMSGSSTDGRRSASP